MHPAGHIIRAKQCCHEYSSGFGRFDYGYIIHVAERVFVEDVSTHLVRLETMRNARFPFCADTDKFNSEQKKLDTFEAGAFK